MSLPVRITAREQVGDRIVLLTVEGDTFDECVIALQKKRAERPDGPPIPVLLTGATT